MGPVLPLEQRLKRSDVPHLPNLTFEMTRAVHIIQEIGMISQLFADGEIKSSGSMLILGVYRDAATDMDYLIHASSERPSGGFPEATAFDQITRYERRLKTPYLG